MVLLFIPIVHGTQGNWAIGSGLQPGIAVHPGGGAENRLPAFQCLVEMKRTIRIIPLWLKNSVQNDY